VRRRASGLQAIVLDQPELIDLVSGERVQGYPGDIRIVRGSLTVDLVKPVRFPTDYEVVSPEQLALTPVVCRQLEDRLGLGSIASPDALIAAVDRLGSIRIGDVRIPFTPGQLHELQHRATKRGRTIEQEIKAVVDRIQDELFHKGG